MQTPVLEASECGNLRGQEVTWKGGRKERSAGAGSSRALESVGFFYFSIFYFSPAGITGSASAFGYTFLTIIWAD